MFIAKRLVSDFICLLYPDLCNGCGIQLFHGERQICSKCLYDLPYTDFDQYSDNPIAKLFWGRIRCHNAMAMLYFRKESKVQNLIHRLKYKNQTSVGLVLGRLLGERLLQSDNYFDADLIIPIPLHPKKERIRGYNQSTFIAEGIAEILNIPVSHTNLIRQKNTESQTKKSRYQRFENMQCVFMVSDPESLKDKHILLIDDVITTGATFEACGAILLGHSIKKLGIVALAYTE